MKNPELWHRLSGFEFDLQEVDFSFSDRLARENNWSRNFTLQVLEEYRRFLYLACVADHEVTPSDEVDQAWHLHLCYTRSYWHDLCRDTLGCPLHHGPTKGGSRDAARFPRQYEATFDSYRTEFGAEPPSQVWPDSRTRFQRRRIAKVDRAQYVIFSKPALQLAAVVTTVSVCLLGCSVTDLENTEFFGIFLAVFAVICLFGILKNRKDGGGGCGGGCSTLSGPGGGGIDGGDSGGGCGGCGGD